MVSVFDEAFEDGALPVLMAGLGDTVTYTPAGESGVSKEVLVTREVSREVSNGAGLVSLRTATVQIAAADVSRAPARGDLFTIDGEVYGVDEVRGPDGGVYVVMCVAEEVERIGGTWN